MCGPGMTGSAPEGWSLRSEQPLHSQGSLRSCAGHVKPALGSARRCSAIDTLGQELCQVLDLELVPGALGRDPVAEHGQAERAGGCYPGRLGPQGLLDACMVDPLPDLLLHPHPAPAGAAAEATLVVPLDLYQLGAGNRLHHGAWSIVDVVPAAQVARVVVCELTLHRPGGFEPALRHQLRKQLSVVDHLVGAAELGELILDGVETMRTGRDHLAHFSFVHRLDVLLRLVLVSVLIATSAAGDALAGRFR